MGKSIFRSSLKKPRVFKVEKVNFNVPEQKGTCNLICKSEHYILIWRVENYPTETANMPGAPYPVSVSYTILHQGVNQEKDSNNSASGRFTYEVNSGTLPNYSQLGIPHGLYYSLARNNEYDTNFNVKFVLFEDGLKLCIYRC